MGLLVDINDKRTEEVKTGAYAKIMRISGDSSRGFNVHIRIWASQAAREASKTPLTTRRIQVPFVEESTQNIISECYDQVKRVSAEFVSAEDV